MAKNYFRRKISPFIHSAAVVLISALFVVSVVYAATTIGSNITTSGNLTVSGNATTTGNFIIGASSWDAPTSTLTVIGNAYLNKKATTSDAFWIGTGGTANNINLAGGDLYVQNDAECDGTFYGVSSQWSSTLNVSGLSTFATATSTSATTSDYLMIGRGSPSFNYKGDLWVKDAVEIGGSATTSADFVVGSESRAATTTVKIKADATGGNGSSCVEWVNVEGAIYREYVNGAGTKVLEAGACK